MYNQICCVSMPYIHITFPQAHLLLFKYRPIQIQPRGYFSVSCLCYLGCDSICPRHQLCDGSGCMKCAPGSLTLRISTREPKSPHTTKELCIVPSSDIASIAGKPLGLHCDQEDQEGLPGSCHLSTCQSWAS